MFNLFKKRKKNPAPTQPSFLSRDTASASESLPPLTDADYEFLWFQLLEGVAHGWHSQRLIRFFKELKARGKEELWLEWLERFKDKLLASANPNPALGARMIQFGEKSQAHLPIKKIGEKSAQIGRQLLRQKPGKTIWEYDGPDLPEPQTQVTVEPETPAPSSPPLVPEPPPESGIPVEDVLPTPEVSFEADSSEPEPSALPSETIVSPPPSEAETITAETEPVSDPWQESSPDLPESVTPPAPETVERLTVDQLIERLQQDLNIRREVASQLGVDANDIEGVIRALKIKMGMEPPESPTPPVASPPETEPETETESPPTQTQPEFEQWFYQGLDYADQGKMIDAIACWDRAIALNPNISAIWHNRGSALGHLGRLDEAIASFDKAIEINPKDFQAWNDRGNALYNMQKWADALYSWKSAVEIKPDYTQAWYSRGCALEHLHRYEEALQCYDTALELKPDFQMVIARRSNLKKRMGL